MKEITAEQWKWVAVSQLRAAPWNYKKTEGREVEEAKEKLRAAMNKRGVIINLLVRPIGVESGYPIYEVVNGNHRLEVLLEEKILEAMCCDLGDISVQEAEITAVETNEIRFDPDPLRLAALIKDVGSIYSNDVIVETTPYTLIDVQGYTRQFPNGSPETESKENDTYSKKITIPIYEPKGPKPTINELCVQETTNRLIEAIKQSLSVTDEEKDFLILAAQRHLVFNYQSIAEYYSQSNSDVQNLMEKSALVIIDFQKAIENGFVQMSEEMAEAYKE